MDLKEHAKYALQRARWITEQLLESFQTEDDWFYQCHPTANHAMWIVGHLGLADNSFTSRFREQLADKPAGWDELFWFGSELQSDRGVYPSSDEVLTYFRNRRETLLSTIDDLTDDELQAPAPPAGEMHPVAGAPCIGHILLFAASHEWMHSGQLTVARRGLGHTPLFAPS